MRQVANKPNRIRQRNRPISFAQIELTRRGVQRGKQLVGRIGTRFHQRVKECGLTGIGIPDERNIEGASSVALFALGLALMQVIVRVRLF